MLFYNQRIPERNHEKDAQDTAAQCNQRDLHKARHIAQTFFRPQKQCRHGKDRTGCQRLTGRAGRLNHIALQDGILLHDHADHTHGNNGCRYGCRHGHTNPKAKICIGSSEYDRQNDTHDDRGDCKFRRDLFRRNIRFELFVFVHVFFSLNLIIVSHQAARTCLSPVI